jgi:hypothetical protein
MERLVSVVVSRPFVNDATVPADGAAPVACDPSPELCDPPPGPHDPLLLVLVGGLCTLPNS